MRKNKTAFIFYGFILNLVLILFFNHISIGTGYEFVMGVLTGMIVSAITFSIANDCEDKF